VRFGDPECQVTLPLVATDMYDLLHGAATDRLHEVELEVHDDVALTVVLASEGYPASPIKGRHIDGLSEVLDEEAYGGAWINFAGVARDDDGHFIASGGRVLSCTAQGSDLQSTHDQAYALLQKITLEGGHHRTDIGHRAME
jgi:phosphoribosylamine--glycine ligase